VAILGIRLTGEDSEDTSDEREAQAYSASLPASTISLADKEVFPVTEYLAGTCAGAEAAQTGYMEWVF
jgi:hypothetical protein